MFRDFAEKVIRPRAAEMDETEEFPHDIIDQLTEMGLMGLPYPEEYGGAGLDTLTYIAAIEEFCKVCGTMGIILSSHISLCQWPIFTFGTEAQKQGGVHHLTQLTCLNDQGGLHTFLHGDQVVVYGTDS